MTNLEEFLKQKITVLSPVDSKVDTVDIIRCLARRFKTLCHDVQDELNISCEDDSLLLLLLAYYLERR